MNCTNTELCNIILGIIAGLSSCCFPDTGGAPPPGSQKYNIVSSIVIGIIFFYIGSYIFSKIEITQSHSVVFGFLSGLIFNLRFGKSISNLIRNNIPTKNK